MHQWLVLLQKTRRNLVDYVELGIVVISVVIYYVLRGLTSPVPAAVISIAIGFTGLYIFISNPHIHTTVTNWGDQKIA